MNSDLSAPELKKLLEPVTNSEVITELYSFGQLLLADLRDNNKQIESKAGTILGWSTGIAAFLLTQSSGEKSLAMLVLIGLISLACTVAIGCAYAALKSRAGWLVASDRDWFKDNSFENPDDMKLFHIRSLHDMKANQIFMVRTKGKWLHVAETALSAAAALLIVGILGKLSVTLPLLVGDRFF